MSQTNTTTDDDTLWLIFIGAFALSAFPVATLFAPVRGWMIDTGILIVGEDVLIPIVDGAGLDIWRIAIIAGVMLVGLMLLFLSISARVRRGRNRV